MPDNEPFRSFTLSEELYRRYDQMRKQKAKLIGLPKLSWSKFLGSVVERLEKNLPK